jgi:hypothetical protein
MASRFKIFNGPSPTTAAQVAVTTGTSIKTLLQIKPTKLGKIIAWGISFNGSAAATPIVCELLETGTVAATVTAHVDAGLVKLGGSDQTVGSDFMTLSTTTTGYTSTSEGSITVSRMFDCQFVAPTNQYIYQFPLGQEPIMLTTNYTRIRVTAPAAVNAYCWIECEF